MHEQILDGGELHFHAPQESGDTAVRSFPLLRFGTALSKEGTYLRTLPAGLREFPVRRCFP